MKSSVLSSSLGLGLAFALVGIACSSHAIDGDDDPALERPSERAPERGLRARNIVTDVLDAATDAIFSPALDADAPPVDSGSTSGSTTDAAPADDGGSSSKDASKEVDDAGGEPEDSGATSSSSSSSSSSGGSSGGSSSSSSGNSASSSSEATSGGGAGNRDAAAAAATSSGATVAPGSSGLTIDPGNSGDDGDGCTTAPGPFQASSGVALGLAIAGLSLVRRQRRREGGRV